MFNHLSRGPGPRSTVNKHSIEIISSLLCSLIFVLSALPLTLSISLCLFISLVLYPLLPLSMCFYPPSLLFLSSSSPLALWGFLDLCSRGVSSFFKPLCRCLPRRTWQQSVNLLSCSLFAVVPPPPHTLSPTSSLGMWSSCGHISRWAPATSRSHKITYFKLTLVQRMFEQGSIGCVLKHKHQWP